MRRASLSFDVIVAGGGIVGSACALACAKSGFHTVLVEREFPGCGATAAGMGHVVVMDDSEAQFALTRRSQTLWHSLQTTLPADAEYETRGTVWVAADQEELEEAERKHAYLEQREVPSRLLSGREMADLEPNLRPGLAGGLLVLEDAVVYPPAVVRNLTSELQQLGSKVIQGRIQYLGDGEAVLEDGTVLGATHLINAMGADAGIYTPGIPLKKRKGHLAITDRYADFARHQLVELGYLKSAHSTTSDSVAFNVQPRQTGQLLIGSSRQYENEDSAVDQTILAAMLERAMLYMPEIATLQVIRIWTGFRAATPDKLPLIGPIPGDSSLWLATGHEGLGITTALATAELLACALTGKQPAIDPTPYLPSRFNRLNTQKPHLVQETT